MNLWSRCSRLLFRQFQGINIRMAVTNISKTGPRTKPFVTKKMKTSSGYFLLVIPITTFGLGTWQIQRREWKLGLIKELESRTTAEIVPLPENLGELKDFEYRRVRVKGTFNHDQEMLIGPRSNIAADESHNFRTRDAVHKIGFNIVTPFKLSDRDLTVLINRGWVNTKQKKAETRPKGQVTEEVEIVGIVRLTDPRRPFSPKNDPETHGYWLQRDVELMAEAAGCAPVFLDADVKSSISGGPTGGQTRVTLRNDHLTYIFTWYTLCAFTSWMWYRMFHRPPPPEPTAMIMQRMKRK